MATIKLIKVIYKRTKLNCDHEFNTYTYRCICSECKKYIGSPANGIMYWHCYNCGAKFDTPIGAKEIRKVKNGE